MNVKVFSRAKAIARSYKDYSDSKVIISINDPFDYPAKFNPNNKAIKDVLYLSFYDISKETKDIFGGYESMSEDDAMKIAEFVRKWKDKVDAIWVHCEYGVSRSSGVALAIIDYLNMNLTPILNNTKYLPNGSRIQRRNRQNRKCSAVH